VEGEGKGEWKGRKGEGEGEGKGMGGGKKRGSDLPDQCLTASYAPVEVLGE